MESKKGSGTIEVHSAATDSSVHERDTPAPRGMTQRIRESVDLRRTSRRDSRSSESSEVRRSTSVSCVTRQASGDDCAKQRFIVWAAVKRNRSIRMAPSDRLRCPLLRCGEQFCDHETMLRHLNGCRHLDAGEYLCYDCMKVEKFNDGKCRCCLSHQTKRRRILNAAKKVFSTLGHKSRRDGSFEVGQDDFAILPPPSYESLDIEQEQDPTQQLQLPIQPEISGNPICEMDAQPALPVELASINYETRHDNLQSFHETDNFLPSASPFLVPPPPKHRLQDLHINNGSRPSLTLDTNNTGRPIKVPRTKYLSPSSSLRSNSSSQGIISPISAGSGVWTNSSTIDTTLTSPITPFSSDVESSALSRENSCKFPKDFPLPSLLSNWNTHTEKDTSLGNMGLAISEAGYAMNNVSELPGDLPIDMAVPRSWENDPLLFSLDSRENYSWSSTVDTQVNVLFTGDGANAEMQNEAFNCDTKTLVVDTWEALKQQMTFSTSNIAHVSNPLARRFETFSAKDIVSRGLATLQSILNGVDPTDPLDYLCFIHLIYVFSVIIHEEDVSRSVHKLFKQALAYRNFLSARDRSAYSAIVSAIWEPADSQGSDASLGRSSSLKGKEPELRVDSAISFKADPLIGVAQNFLDAYQIISGSSQNSSQQHEANDEPDLEMSTLNGDANTRPLEILTSELYSTHIAETGPDSHIATDAFSITVNYIIQRLSQKFGTINNELTPRLRAISQRVSHGYISTVRRLELELLQVGKNILPSIELFDDFIPYVRTLCDPIYGQHGSSPRTKYHKLGIALVVSLVQSLDSHRASVPSLAASSHEHETNSNFTLDLVDEPDPLAEFLKDFDNSAFAEHSFLGSGATPLMGTMGDSLDTSVRVTESRTTEALTTHTVDPTSLSHTGSDAESSSRTEKRKRPTLEQDYSSHMPMPTTTLTPSTCTNTNDATTVVTPGEGGTSGQKTEANDCCELCGYRPKGDPQWFKGSMAKHKKLQHSTEPPKIYRCKFPGCSSAYKNRPDNLRQHQIEKGHFTDGETKQKRPGKRKKLDDD